MAKQTKATAGIIFGSVELPPAVEGCDAEGSCSFPRMDTKQKGTRIPVLIL